MFADRFHVTRLVSTGANTAIFDASDSETGRVVTLKLIRPKLAASPSFRTRFDETMGAVSALSHPNIAAVFDWGLARVGDTSTAYVVNEHLTGGSLRDLFDRGRRLSPSQALAVGLDACRALDHAHRRRFVHTELNPSKFVWGDDRRLRIVDFGLSQLLGESTWQQPDSVPTHVAWYAAPEQGLGEPLDGRADVYALALVLHEAVTGSLPFKNDSTVAALSARVGRLMPVSADLGPLASVLERAGRPNADERATAAELGKSLLQAAPKLPRPQPLPLLSSGLFDTPVEQLRNPDDPTGGVFRDQPSAPPPLVVPLDEPDADADTDTDAGPAIEPEPAGDADPSEPDQAPVTGIVIPPVGSDAEPGGEPEPADEPELPLTDPVDDLVILPLDADESPSGPVVSATPRQPAVTTEMAAMSPPVDEPRRRRRFPWKVLLGLLVVAALVVLGVLATRLFRTPTHVVPDLTAMPEAEARNLIAPNGWVVTVERERSDEQPVVGNVIRTAPAAGVELAEEEPFLMVVSDGPLLRELPESTGRTLADAQSDLAERQLAVEVEEANDEVVPEGTVISWSVPGDATLIAGSQVEPETVVHLVVSVGPAPRTVPNLAGLPSAEAQAAIEQLGLVFTIAGQPFSDDVPLGVVISQNIAEGTQVTRGSEVTVAVSAGPDLVTFPDLTGQPNFDAAAALLVQSGFQPVLTFGDAQGAIQSFTIDGQPPLVGNTYRRGTVVEFTAL
jgi:beta-lactam-binding protein with PASTA domain/serine/threonine protein kinase